MNRPLRVLACLLACAFTASSTSADTIDALRTYLKTPASVRGDLTDQAFVNVPLSKAQAQAALDLLWADRRDRLKQEHADEWQSRSIVDRDKTMRFDVRTYGSKPKNGWPLFISLHGGGNAPAEVNDQQWRNQQRLYQPIDAIYVTPRAPTNTWNLWHEPHIDRMLGRLIENAILFEDVDPNRVYLTGYSAGGDGVYQLAPRMADRFAAAAMMAGHPNDASPLGLRNLPFAIHMGALDHAYNRATVAAEWGKQLDHLQETDPAGYPHDVQIHAGEGHWMSRKDAVAIEWMGKFARVTNPDRIVWRQASVPHTRFYWLGVRRDAVPIPGQTLDVRREGQSFFIEQAKDIDRFELLLNDDVVDLDQPVVIRIGDRILLETKATRTIHAIDQSLTQRADPTAAYTSILRTPPLP